MRLRAPPRRRWDKCFILDFRTGRPFLEGEPPDPDDELMEFFHGTVWCGITRRRLDDLLTLGPLWGGLFRAAADAAGASGRGLIASGQDQRFQRVKRSRHALERKLKKAVSCRLSPLVRSCFSRFALSQTEAPPDPNHSFGRPKSPYFFDQLCDQTGLSIIHAIDDLLICFPAAFCPAVRGLMLSLPAIFGDMSFSGPSRPPGATGSDFEELLDLLPVSFS